MHVSKYLINQPQAPPQSDKLLELKTKLMEAKKVKNMPLCRILLEAQKKQAESDAALAIDDFDAVDLLDAEVFISDQLLANFLFQNVPSCQVAALEVKATAVSATSIPSVSTFHYFISILYSHKCNLTPCSICIILKIQL